MSIYDKDAETHKSIENKRSSEDHPTDCLPPWRDPSLLEELYHGRGMSQPEIADELGCCVATVSKWMRRHGIPTRGPMVGPSLGRTANGYIQFSDGERTVMSHQLAACIHTDPHEVFDDEAVVHHGTHHPFDNRPSNLEVMDRGDHARLHHRGDWVWENGEPRLRVPLVDGGD